MIRSTVAHVDLGALRDNFLAVRQFVEGNSGQSSPDLVAVVKANAYGHGAEQVALALQDAGARMLACADIEEGVALRQAGVTVPILVFGALSVSDLDGLFEYSLTPTISSPAAAEAVQSAASRSRVVIGYHLKVDTGMHRLGFRHDNLEKTLPSLLASQNLNLEAVYTHFATADDSHTELFNEQRLRFDQAVSTVRKLGGAPKICHAANSAALLRDSRVWYDAVRPGLLLYGIVPPLNWTSPMSQLQEEGFQTFFRSATKLLRPVLSLTSRVVAVKGLRPGEGTGYGWNYRAETPMSIAVIPAGYADGVDTRLSGHGDVLIRGKRVRIVGAISMDMMMVDVTNCGVQPGDEVVIIGQQGHESWQTIDAREMAEAIGTIPWEILCRLGSRIERQYLQS